MQIQSGLLTKISSNQYRLLTTDGELIIDENLNLCDGFHSSIDLTNVNSSYKKLSQFVASNTFSKGQIAVSMKSADCECSNDCSAYDDCSTTSDCDCYSGSDDCSNPNDCDCDCSN